LGSFVIGNIDTL